MADYYMLFAKNCLNIENLEIYGLSLKSNHI